MHNTLKISSCFKNNLFKYKKISVIISLSLLLAAFYVYYSSESKLAQTDENLSADAFTAKKIEQNVQITEISEINLTDTVLAVDNEYYEENHDHEHKLEHELENKKVKEGISENLSYDKNKFEPFFVPSRNQTAIRPKNYVCPASILNKKQRELKEYVYDPKPKEILILQSESESDFLLNVKYILQTSKIKFNLATKISFENKPVPPLIIFESYNEFLEYQESEEFKKYVQKNKIGLMIFNKNKQRDQNVEFTECQLNDDKFQENFLYMTKLNTQKFQIKKTMKYNKEFKNLFYEKETSKTILKCEQNNNIEEILFVNTINEIKYAFISIELIDDIWLLKSLFLDSIRYLTNGAIDIGLKRYVQIDIDDIFAVKMYPQDANEVIKLQDDLSKKYFYNNEHSFKFVIGFCGKKYNDKDYDEEYEIEADNIFLSN